MKLVEKLNAKLREAKKAYLNISKPFVSADKKHKELLKLIKALRSHKPSKVQLSRQDNVKLQDLENWVTTDEKLDSDHLAELNSIRVALLPYLDRYRDNL